MSNLAQDVFRVLVSSPSIAPAAEGETLTDLEVGQLGFFDVDTNLAIDGDPRNNDFYIALKTSATNVITNAGQFIRPSKIKHIAFRPHTPAQPQIVEVGVTAVVANEDYILKIEQRNQEIYRTQGYAQALRSYPVSADSTSTISSVIAGFKSRVDADVDSGVTTSYGAQSGSIVVTTAPTGDGNATVTIDGNAIVVALLDADTDAGAATKIAAAINTADVGYTASAATATVTIYQDAPNAGVKTIAVAAGATGIVATITNISSIEVADLTTLPAGVLPTLRLTTIDLDENNMGSVNTKYYALRQNHIVASLSGDTLEKGFVNTAQVGAFEEGSGYDLRQKEYVAGGWEGNPGPYRTSDVVGVANQITYQASVDANYDTVILTYQVPSNVGFQQFENPATTIIAFPTTSGGSTVAIDAFIAILDLITADYGFEGLTDDVEAANDDPTVNEPTSGKTYATDGIA